MQKAVIVREAFGKSWTEETDGSGPARPLADLLAEGWKPLRQFPLPATEMGGYLLLVGQARADLPQTMGNDVPLSSLNGPIPAMGLSDSEPTWDGETLSIQCFGVFS